MQSRLHQRRRGRGAGVALAPYLSKAGIVSASTAPACRPAPRPRAARLPRPGRRGQPVRHGRRLHRRRGDLQRRLRHRLRHSSPPTSSPRSTRARRRRSRRRRRSPRSCSRASSAATRPTSSTTRAPSRSGSARSSTSSRTSTDVFEAPNLEGTKIRDTLYGGVKLPGTFGGKFVGDELRAHRLRHLVLVEPVRGRTAGPRRRPGTRRWPSAPRPRRRASTSSCGARRRRRTTRRWPSTRPSRRAATRSASALENLQADCWSHPAIQAVFTALEGDRRRRLLQARRRRHAVHGRPGAVEQRPGGDALPVGLVDRERDEGRRRRRASR